MLYFYLNMFTCGCLWGQSLPCSQWNLQNEAFHFSEVHPGGKKNVSIRLRLSIFYAVLNCDLSSPDSGSHPGVLAAPAGAGFFRAGGSRAQIHRPAGYRTHHQPYWPLSLHWSWKEVWDSLGNSCSVSLYQNAGLTLWPQLGSFFNASTSLLEVILKKKKKNLKL